MAAAQKELEEAKAPNACVGVPPQSAISGSVCCGGEPVGHRTLGANAAPVALTSTVVQDVSLASTVEPPMPRPSNGEVSHLRGVAAMVVASATALAGVADGRDRGVRGEAPEKSVMSWEITS